MALSLDRQAFIDILTEGRGNLGGAMQPPPEGLWGMPPEMLMELPGYDPDVAKNRGEARQIMQRLGYGPTSRLPVKVTVRDLPYLRDPARRLYRDGGGAFGEALSLRILREGLVHLAPRARLVLYTGSAIVDGHDLFRAQVEKVVSEAGLVYDYSEIDPDVFGEELEAASYRNVERIAAVSVIVCG